MKNIDKYERFDTLSRSVHSPPLKAKGGRWPGGVEWRGLELFGIRRLRGRTLNRSAAIVQERPSCARRSVLVLPFHLAMDYRVRRFHRRSDPRVVLFELHPQ